MLTYYLTYQSKKIGYNPRLILAGRDLNDQMPNFIYNEIKKKITQKKISKPKVLIMGLTFKENCPDTRNSKSLNLFDYFNKNNFTVYSYDPYYKFWSSEFKKKYNVLPKIYKNYFDVIILSVKHKEFKKQNLEFLNYCSNKGFIYDLKYVLPENHKHFRLWIIKNLN